MQVLYGINMSSDIFIQPGEWSIVFLDRWQVIAGNCRLLLNSLRIIYKGEVDYEKIIEVNGDTYGYSYCNRKFRSMWEER
jgi:hypothetical protein